MFVFTASLLWAFRLWHSVLCNTVYCCAVQHTIQGVSGGIVIILGGGSMDYSQ